MGKIDVQSYRAHTEVLSFLILSKSLEQVVVQWWIEEKKIKKFHIKDI